jgi:hypothetical protein
MRLAYVVAKFSANNGKPLPVTVPTVVRVYWHDLAGTVDPNVRVTTARYVVITISASKPRAGG